MPTSYQQLISVICAITSHSQYSLLNPLDWLLSSNHQQFTPVSRSQTAVFPCCTSFVEQASSYTSCSLSVWCMIMLFSVIMCCCRQLTAQI